MSITLENYLTSYMKEISKENIELVKSRSTYKTYRKGDIIIDYGQHSETFFVLKSGFVANFSLLKTGNTFIRTIFSISDEFGSLQSFISKKKTNIVFKALTDCEVYELKTADYFLRKIK